MEGARFRKSHHSVFILSNVAIFLALSLAAEQVRLGAALQVDATTPVFDPGEFTPTLTDTEFPSSETPSPLPVSPSLTSSPSPTDTPQPTNIPDETPVEQTLLLVGLSEAISVESFERNISYPVIDIELDTLGIYAVQVPVMQAGEIMESLLGLPDVRYAEPNYAVTAQDTLPNDPAFPQQYALANIRAPQAWDVTTGSSMVTIAIIDSGVDLSHSEIAPKLLLGRDFVNDDDFPQDDNGHGTHVAGIAASSSNNGLGMAGVSWGARILPIKVLDASNSGSYADVAAGIVWAVDQGAQIINLSLGGIDPSQTLEDAIDYAASRGVALVAAAGNTSGDILYPARYPAVIAVANTNAANQRVSSSGFGPAIDLAAPGASIYSLAIGGGYRYLGGTSMSAPHVSGALALLLSMPGVSTGQARAHLEASALDLDPPGWDIFTGSGLIQLDAALLRAIPASPTLLPATDTPPARLQTPVPTSSSLPTGGGWFAASPTQTATTVLLIASPTFSQTPTALFISQTPNPTLSPSTTVFAAATAESPTPVRFQWMPCLGMVMLFLGLLLAVWAVRARQCQ